MSEQSRTNNARLSKICAIRLVVQFSSEYVEMLTAFQSPGGRLQLPRKFLDFKDHFKINNYSELYDDERQINVSLLLALFGDEGLKELNSEVSGMAPEDLESFLVEVAEDGESFDISGFFPANTEEEKAKAIAEFEQLSAEEKSDATKRVQFFWSFFFAQFHNTLSVMVHGEKLTSLVPKVLTRDEY
jgi:hypothetical protein